MMLKNLTVNKIFIANHPDIKPYCLLGQDDFVAMIMNGVGEC